jgi:hypothetical protein
MVRQLPLLPRKHGLSSRSVHVGFVMNRVALGEIFIRVLLFPPVSIIRPVFHISPSLTVYNFSN